MKSKIRFIATLTSLVTTLLVLVLVLPISIYAAGQANVNGRGGLTSVPKKQQINDLSDLGFHASGDDKYTINLQSMQAISGDVESLKQKAISGGVLSYELYKKINCQDSKQYLYELQVVLDFSNFNIATYSQRFIQYYNQIAFCSDISGLALYDFYTGNIIESNINVKFTTNTTNDRTGYKLSLFKNENIYDESATIQYAYRIILNNYYDKEGNLGSISLNHKCLKMYDTSNETIIESNLKNGVTPAVIYIDISKMKFSYDTNGSVVGIVFASSGGIEDTDLTDNNHIHVIGENNNQYEVGLQITKDYISYHNDYEVSIYKKEANYKYAILCKVLFVPELDTDGEPIKQGYINFIVIDDAYYTDTNLNDVQRRAITNMCFWIKKNNLTSVVGQYAKGILIYHQKIDSNMAFAGDPIEVAYRESQTHSGWQEVYYVSNNEIIGYFNANEIDVNVTTN